VGRSNFPQAEIERQAAVPRPRTQRTRGPDRSGPLRSLFDRHPGALDRSRDAGVDAWQAARRVEVGDRRRHRAGRASTRDRKLGFFNKRAAATWKLHEEVLKP